MYVFGDAHGNIDKYYQLIKQADMMGKPTLLLGELGFQSEHDWFIDSKFGSSHNILFGNHDFFPYINKPHSFGRFKAWDEPNGKYFSVAGAFSIDKIYRKVGVTWFDNEQINEMEMKKCLALYKKFKPDYVLTHDAPSSIINKLFNYRKLIDPTAYITNDFLDVLLSTHRPKSWVFAHHHKSIDIVIDNTRFICLNQLERFDTNKF